MFWPALLLFSALPVSFAGDSDSLVFCGEDEPDVSICEQRVSDSCYDCLHPIESSCGDESQDPVGYGNCFCTFPGQSWNAIEKCLGDPTTGCADWQKYILNAYGVDCATSARADMFNYEVCGVPQTDPLAQALVEIHCSDVVLSTTVTASSTSFSVPTATNTVSTSASTVPISTSTVPTSTSTVPTATSTVITGTKSTSITSTPTASASHIPSASNTTTKPPTFTGGVSSLKAAGVNAVALMAGAVIYAI